MANDILRLGIIGLSEGNGHPYSWSAIFNGYDQKGMEFCGFPGIPEYLSKQVFPDDGIDEAKVTHVWTQNIKLSNHIAETCFIDNVVENFEDMIGHVDAVLLARDDADRHFQMAKPFIEAGLPIYIDKPVALSLSELNKIYSLSKYPSQIFTCSALAYAKEFLLTDKDRNELGKILNVVGMFPKRWDTYSVHIIEPILKNIGAQGEIVDFTCFRSEEDVSLHLEWESGVKATIQNFGNAKVPFQVTYIGEETHKQLTFENSFSAFRSSLLDFIQSVCDKRPRVNMSELSQVVKLIGIGRAEGKLCE